MYTIYLKDKNGNPKEIVNQRPFTNIEANENMIMCTDSNGECIYMIPINELHYIQRNQEY